MNIPLVKLGDICEVTLGRTPPRENPAWWGTETEGIPWVAIGDMGKSRVLTTTKERVSTSAIEGPFKGRIVPKGTLLLSFKLSIGKVCVLGMDAVHNEAIASIVPKRKDVHIPYLLHVLPLVTQTANATHAVKGKTLNKKALCNLDLPLPPLAEQERIVAHLERTLGAIDAMEAKFREMAETAERHFRATLAESFAALSSAPAAKLGEVCETTSGGTPLKSHKEYYEGGTIPWLRSGEVCKKDIEAAECFITPSGMENSSAKLFPVNTVLVAMYGATAGQVGILRFPATTNQAICGILPSTRFVPEFLYYALLQQKAALVRRAVGGAQPNISQEKIREVVLPLPSLAEQERVVARLERAEGVSRRVVALAQAGVAQCGVYRRAVLSEAFGGGEGGGDE